MATAPLSFSGTVVPGLAYSQLADLSWVSATDGWALAAQPCASGTCARLARTTDGGVHWQPLPDPPARLQDGTVDCSKVACVSGVRFASPAVGYLYGPALLMTSDGGRTWRQQLGPQVETLTIAGGQVYRVAYDHTGCPGPCLPTLQRAAIGSAAWAPLIGQLATPGRSGAAQIVASGSALLLALFGSHTTLAVSTGAAGGSGAFMARLLVTTDAGRHWNTAATQTQQILQASVPAWPGFATSRTGRWISAPHSIWTTKDSGLHWTRTRFP